MVAIQERLIPVDSHIDAFERWVDQSLTLAQLIDLRAIRVEIQQLQSEMRAVVVAPIVLL